MNRKTMKKIFILIMISFTSLALYSQGQGMDERLRARKAEYINEKLELTGEKKDQFWKIYTGFEQKKRDIRIDMTQNRLGLRKSTITDKEASKIIETELELKQAMVDLEKEYVDRYRDVLTPVQIITLYKAEDDFNKVVMERLRQMRQNRGGQRPGNN